MGWLYLAAALLVAVLALRVIARQHEEESGELDVADLAFFAFVAMLLGALWPLTVAGCALVQAAGITRRAD